MGAVVRLVDRLRQVCPKLGYSDQLAAMSAFRQLHGAVMAGNRSASLNVASRIPRRPCIPQHATAAFQAARSIADLIEHRISQPFFDGGFPPTAASLRDLDLLWERARLDFAVERRSGKPGAIEHGVEP